MQGETGWRQVFIDSIDFGHEPDHLRTFVGPRAGSYYYPSKRYRLREYH
jgi:hypothetical protein